MRGAAHLAEVHTGGAGRFSDRSALYLQSQVPKVSPVHQEEEAENEAVAD